MTNPIPSRPSMIVQRKIQPVSFKCGTRSCHERVSETGGFGQELDKSEQHPQKLCGMLSKICAEIPGTAIFRTRWVPSEFQASGVWSLRCLAPNQHLDSTRPTLKGWTSVRASPGENIPGIHWKDGEGTVVMGYVVWDSLGRCVLNMSWCVLPEHSLRRPYKNTHIVQTCSSTNSLAP